MRILLINNGPALARVQAGIAPSKPCGGESKGGHGKKYTQHQNRRNMHMFIEKLLWWLGKVHAPQAKLARKFDNAILADDVYLDFARIFQLLLDARSDVARELVHRDVRNLPRIHKNANLATC